MNESMKETTLLRNDRGSAMEEVTAAIDLPEPINPNSSIIQSPEFQTLRIRPESVAPEDVIFRNRDPLLPLALSAVDVPSFVRLYR